MVHQLTLFLNVLYSETWIDRGGPAQWAAYSADLKLIDFYIWEHLKAAEGKTGAKKLEM